MRPAPPMFFTPKLTPSLNLLEVGKIIILKADIFRRDCVQLWCNGPAAHPASEPKLSLTVLHFKILNGV